jgi:GH35 family endo-1,4-beta-xylanase
MKKMIMTSSRPNASNNNWPAGRENYPMLFDKNLQPKKAFKAVVSF